MRLLILGVLTSVLSLGAQTPPAAPAGNAETGKRLFNNVGCFQCHGYEAQGGGGARLAPNPIAFAALSKYVRAPSGQMPPSLNSPFPISPLAEVTMLASNKIVGFVATKDYKKARNFHETILGIEFVNQDPFALEFKAGGNIIRISKVDDFTPMPFTVLGWQVDNIQKIVQGLTERGVTFERYSFLKQDDLGIWDAPEGARVAWFKDPDGNLLSVSQHP